MMFHDTACLLPAISRQNDADARLTEPSVNPDTGFPISCGFDLSASVPAHQPAQPWTSCPFSINTEPARQHHPHRRPQHRQIIAFPDKQKGVRIGQTPSKIATL
jgi:hypothetical protein